MSFALQINIERDTATPLLQRLAFIALGEKVNRVAAQGVVAMLKRHFQALDASRSGRQFGGTNATHFYAKVARTIHAEVSATEASVGIGNEETRGIRQRLEGGTIEAGKNISSFTDKPTVYLTIPARGEAYGHRASEFRDRLMIVFAPGGHGVALCEKIEVFNPKRRQSKKPIKLNSVKVNKPAQYKGGEVWYWLVKSVTQDPDPSVMPSNDWIADAAREAVGRWMKRVLTTARIRGELEDLEPESE